MILHSIVLQHFRSYSQATFRFDPLLTVVVGPNTAGKTNLTQAIRFLSQGKGFHAYSDKEVVQFDHDIARVQGMVGEDKTKLEVVILSPTANNGRFGKNFFVNGVRKSRNNFVGFLPVVVFRPEELDIVIAGPSSRRAFLDEVLEQVDRDYVLAVSGYEKALRQRNALLRLAQERGRKNPQQFAYWDDLVITHGQAIHTKRAAFLAWCNSSQKDVVQYEMVYDHSIISEERLNQYDQAEIAAGVTLVGPHRDDFYFLLTDEKGKKRDIKTFGSRGQQRLVVLQLKLLQIAYVVEQLGQKPLLVLDDIFSELDSKHIQLVLEKTQGQQVVVTTTHKEFLPQELRASVIELNNDNAAF